ncbi:MAG: FIST N-terminal domain-containing protein [Actinomycetota bacterium]
MAIQIAPTSSRSASSASASGADAVAAACGAAVDSLDSELGLLVAFTSKLDDARRVAAQLVDASRGAPSVGMTGDGVFAANEPIEDGCVAVAFDKAIECGIGVGGNESKDFRAAGHDAARDALEQLSDQAGLLMLFVDTRAGDLADAIAGAYEVSGPEVPMAGGAASGADPAQYAHGEALTDGVVGVALRSEQPIGVGNAHSCSVVGEPSIVTRSESQLIAEIDGRPAEEVYLERVGGRGQMSDEAFEAMAITHPLAQPEAHGNRRLRHILGRSHERGLLCATHIPAGTAIEFTVLSLDELLRSGWDSVTSSVESLGDHQPEAALVFDCAGRRRVLGHGQAQEVKAITESFGEPPPLAGLYTDGEVARTRGTQGDYNHAVVTVTFA